VIRARLGTASGFGVWVPLLLRLENAEMENAEGESGLYIGSGDVALGWGADMGACFLATAICDSEGTCIDGTFLESDEASAEGEIKVKTVPSSQPKATATWFREV
jgi:hypothetical protein